MEEYRIYVAGPYTGPDWKSVDANIKRVEVVGKVLAKEGALVYMPHMATAHWDDVAPYEYFANLHMTFVKSWATGLYVMPNSSKSKGTRAEFEMAMDMNIPIFSGKVGLEHLIELIRFDKK